MRVAETNDQINLKQIPHYVKGVLATTEHKNCAQLSKTLNKSHDTVLRELNTRPDNELNTLSFAKDVLADEEAILVIDDGRIAKPYAEMIEGASLGHDGSSHRVVMGLQMVTAMLVTQAYKLPVEVHEYISKWIIGSDYLNKSYIAEILTRKLMNMFNISRLIADAHYASHQFISFLTTVNMPYLMKFPCNRKISLFGKYMKLQDCLKLKRNERVRCKKGFYKDISCFFYVIKIDKYKKIYLISSDYIDPHKVIELYKIRWSIEMFHRTAKQFLGYSDCQSRSLSKQLQHCRFVMLAYAIADVYRYQMKLENTEDAVRLLRYAKPISESFKLFFDSGLSIYA